jgi:hypothetical protein
MNTRQVTEFADIVDVRSLTAACVAFIRESRPDVPEDVTPEEFELCMWEVLGQQLARPAASEMARYLAKLVDAELDGENPRLVAQKFSPLGAKAHEEAVRRRLRDAKKRGVKGWDVGAMRIGRRYLLTPESLAEEMGKLAEVGS